MNADQIRRSDFPADGTGYDRASVDAHLAAVAAWVAALEAQIASLGVERNALRRAVPDPAHEPLPLPPEPVVPEPTPEPAAPGPTAIEPEGPGETRSEDEVSARLVATRLALEGVDREEIVARLAEDYEIEEADALVDDVLARLA